MLHDTNLSDDEKAEALKRWWSENGKSVVGGVVLGLALVFGWQGWNEHQRSQAEMAAVEYDRFQVAIQKKDLDAAKLQAEKLSKDFAATAYDYFAAVDLAAEMTAAEDFAGARTQLDYAVSNADDDGLKQLAEVRLARLLVAMGETEAAAKLAQNRSGAFAAEFAQIRGDIERLAGNNEAAAKAYQQAMLSASANNRLLEMKLNEVKTN